MPFAVCLGIAAMMEFVNGVNKWDNSCEMCDVCFNAVLMLFVWALLQSWSSSKASTSGTAGAT
jgi:hypothetical protein